MLFRFFLTIFFLTYQVRENVVFAKTKKLSTDGELLKAAGAGNLERVKYLIEEEMGSVAAKNNYGVSALIFAANNGHKEVVEALLDYGAMLEDRSNNGKTALHWACHWGHLSVVEYLIDQGANVSTVDFDGMTLLMTATFQNHLTIVQYLLEKEVDLFAVNKLGADVLTIARNKQNSELINLLERANYSRQSSSRTVRHSSKLLTFFHYDEWNNVEKDRNPYYILMKLMIAELIFMLEIGKSELLFLSRTLQETSRAYLSVFHYIVTKGYGTFSHEIDNEKVVDKTVPNFPNPSDRLKPSGNKMREMSNEL